MENKNSDVLAVVLFRETYHVFKRDEGGILRSETRADFKDTIEEAAEFLKRDDLYTAISGLKEGNPGFEKLVKESPRNIFFTKECLENYVFFNKARNLDGTEKVKVFMRYDSSDYTKEIHGTERDIGLGTYFNLNKFFEVIGVQDIEHNEWVQSLMLKMEVLSV